MSQNRYTDFGGTVTSSSANNIIKSLTAPGLLKGGNFIIVSPDKLRIQPYTLVTQNGVIITENEVTEVIIPNSTSAANFTIYVKHVNEAIVGGNKAELVVSDGLLPQSNFTDSIVLGYVKYPGGNVFISSDQIIENKGVILDSTQTKDLNADAVLPPFENKFITFSSNGNMSETSVWEVSEKLSYTIIKNIDTIQTNTTKILPALVRKRQPSLFTIHLQADFGAQLEITIIGTDGNSYTPSEITTGLNTVSNTSGFKTFEFLLENKIGAFTPNNQFQIQLDITLGLTKKVCIAYIGISDYNLPF